MTDKELRRLSRSELLEMLIAQTEENSQLKIRLCLLYTSPSPRDAHESRMPSSA